MGALETHPGVNELSEAARDGTRNISDGLLALFRLLLRLDWSPLQVQQHLQEHFGVNTLSQLSVEQLSGWMALLSRRP